MTDLRLRPARPDELGYVIDVKERTLRPDLERLARWEPARSAARVRASFALGGTRVIERDGDRIGTVTLRTADDGARYLEMFHIEPAAQGGGLGSAVLRGLIAECAGDRIRLEVLLASRVRAFYERHGFTVVSSDEIVDVLELAVPADVVGSGPSTT